MVLKTRTVLLSLAGFTMSRFQEHKPGYYTNFCSHLCVCLSVCGSEQPRYIHGGKMGLEFEERIRGLKWRSQVMLVWGGGCNFRFTQAPDNPVLETQLLLLWNPELAHRKIVYPSCFSDTDSSGVSKKARMWLRC